MVTTKINKTIGLLRKLKNLLPRTALIKIYKAFVRPHLDYGDILYDQAFNLSFQQKLESILYRACLAITGAIRGPPKRRFTKRYNLGHTILELYNVLIQIRLTASKTKRDI